MDNPPGRSIEEYSNVASSGSQCTYYNTADLTTNIKIMELQHVISKKKTEKNNEFLAEYKVFFKGHIEMHRKEWGNQIEKMIMIIFVDTFRGYQLGTLALALQESKKKM